MIKFQNFFNVFLVTTFLLRKHVTHCSLERDDSSSEYNSNEYRINILYYYTSCLGKLATQMLRQQS